MEIVDVVVGVLVVGLIFWLLTHAANAGKRAGKTIKRSRQGGPRVKPKYEWEPVTDRYARRAKGVQRLAEDRQGILSFIDSRAGVEAYVEPKTVMHPLSVMLVAGDGEWKRFQLADDSFVRELARTRGVTVFDAARTGYPERMRRNREMPPPAEEDGQQDPGNAHS